MANVEPCLAKASKGAPQVGGKQDAWLNVEGAVCRYQGEMGAKPRCWLWRGHRANTEGRGPEEADDFQSSILE